MSKDELDSDRIWLIRDFLSSEECAELIQRSEARVFEPATLGDEIVVGVRSNDRVIYDDPSLAADLFLRAQRFLPDTIGGLRLAGFNERFRFYRYGPGQTFRPHRDGMFERLEEWAESRLTFMIYLNDQVTRGETRFFADMETAFHNQPYISVRPELGMALVFVHRVLHEGAVVRSGRKYVLRTDVMFSGPPELHDGTREPSISPPGRQGS